MGNLPQLRVCAVAIRVAFSSSVFENNDSNFELSRCLFCSPAQSALGKAGIERRSAGGAHGKPGIKLRHQPATGTKVEPRFGNNRSQVRETNKRRTPFLCHVYMWKSVPGIEVESVMHELTNAWRRLAATIHLHGIIRKRKRQCQCHHESVLMDAEN